MLDGPYSTTRSTNGAMPTDYVFTGQRGDTTTGLDYYGARYYDPSVGQFTSADSDPRGGLNRYAYVHDDPETFTDPTGHLLFCGDSCGGGGDTDPTPPPNPVDCGWICHHPVGTSCAFGQQYCPWFWHQCQVGTCTTPTPTPTQTPRVPSLPGADCDAVNCAQPVVASGCGGAPECGVGIDRGGLWSLVGFLGDPLGVLEQGNCQKEGYAGCGQNGAVPFQWMINQLNGIKAGGDSIFGLWEAALGLGGGASSAATAVAALIKNVGLGVTFGLLAVGAFIGDFAVLALQKAWDASIGAAIGEVAALQNEFTNDPSLLGHGGQYWVSATAIRAVYAVPGFDVSAGAVDGIAALLPWFGEAISISVWSAGS